MKLVEKTGLSNDLSQQHVSIVSENFIFC